MTDAQLDELDKLAAEKVMGLDYFHPKDNPSLPICSPNFVWSRDWQPTRDIAQAWELLERFKLNKARVEYHLGYWGCTISLEEENCFPMFHAKSKSPAEAITLACLRAKGVEVKE